MHEIREGEDLQFAARGAGVDAALEGVGGDATGEVAVEGADGGALDVVLEDEVRDARDGIRPVDGGSPVLEDFDAGEGVDRDHVEIHELDGAERGRTAALREGSRGEAAAVEEDEGGVGAEAAERNGGGAGRGRVDAVFAEAVGAGLGDLFDEIVEGAGGGLLDLGSRDDAEIGAAEGFAGAEIGAGDGEGFELHGFGSAGSGGLGERERRQRGGDKEGSEGVVHGRWIGRSKQ